MTEGGYFIDAATGSFDPNAAEIVADAAAPSRPAPPLARSSRPCGCARAAGVAPFTVMSCDNLPGNGHVTQDAVVGLARLSDPAFADWIAANVAFPNGMVDRITPATGPRERAMAADFGLPTTRARHLRAVPSMGAGGQLPRRPPGARKGRRDLHHHVHAFETMKIRILNGGHATIAYPGGLMDIEHVHEAMADPMIRAFLDAVETREILPIVPAGPRSGPDRLQDA